MREINDGNEWAEEQFIYDLQHRLKSSDRFEGTGLPTNGATSYATIAYSYSPNGNLLSKSDYAHSYTYNTSQVSSVLNASSN